MIAKSLNLPTGIVFEDEDHIHVAGPVIREGVFNGALQEYQDFEKDIPGLVGLKYIRGEHPKDHTGKFRPVENSDDIIGTLIDAKGVPDKKLAWGIWNIQKKLLTQAEVDKVHAGEPIGTSPGYWCDEEKLGKPEIYIPTGEIYYKKERGPRKFDHIASPEVPACKKCGPFHAASQDGGGNIVEGEEDKFPDICHKRFIVKGLWSDDELKKMIGEVLAIDPMQIDQHQAMKKLLTQILVGLDAAPIKIQSEESMDNIDLKLLVQSEEFKAVLDTATTEALKEPLEKLSQADKTIETLATELKAAKEANELLLADKAARDEAATKAAAEQETSKMAELKKMFTGWLKPGKEADAEKLWETAKTNPWQFKIENPGHFVVQSQEKTKFTPAGATVSGEGHQEETIRRDDGMIVKADSGDIDWGAMGIKAPDVLAAELGYTEPAGGK